jgi:hypothetical protein
MASQLRHKPTANLRNSVPATAGKHVFEPFDNLPPDQLIQPPGQAAAASNAGSSARMNICSSALIRDRLVMSRRASR